MVGASGGASGGSVSVSSWGRVNSDGYHADTGEFRLWRVRRHSPQADELVALFALPYDTGSLEVLRLASRAFSDSPVTPPPNPVPEKEEKLRDVGCGICGSLLDPGMWKEHFEYHLGERWQAPETFPPSSVPRVEVRVETNYDWPARPQHELYVGSQLVQRFEAINVAEEIARRIRKGLGG